jgi:hypothetical protein
VEPIIAEKMICMLLKLRKINVDNRDNGLLLKEGL